MDIQSLFGINKNTVVLVTGGGRGIGRMIANGYVANGATVYVSSRTASACEATASELSAQGPGRCIALPADLGSYDECIRVKEEIEKRSGILHVLVNNSGISHSETFDIYPDDAWPDIMNINVRRVFTLTQALMPFLEKGYKRDGVGRVINIGTIYALSITRSESYAYCASKAALHHLTKHLAQQLGPRGITVNALALGPFNTDLLAQSLADGEEMIANTLPLRRIGRPEDVASACLWLSGKGGSWITGGIIPVDGGSLVVPQGVM